MKRQDILKVLEEANKVSSNLTDRQIEMYASEHRKSLGLKTINKNRNKDAASKGGKKGGKIIGNRIKNGEKIGFFAIPMKERIEKYFSKPRPNRRIFSKKDLEYIKKVYYRPTNQFDKIPKGKKSIKELIEKFDVSKNCILNALKNNYKN